MPSIPQPDPEEALRTLAGLVAECRELAGKLGHLDAVPSRRAAPFLYRQFAQSLQLLGQAVQVAGERAEDATAGSSSTQGGGLLGRLKRSILGGSRKEEERLDEGLQGNSWTIAIPELIGFLSNARKTGALWVHAPNETFLLQLRDGVLLHATSDCTPEGERLGELLVAEGALSAEELASFLATPSSSGILGLSLHREGLVTEEELLQALAIQVQRLFHRMLSARNSVFRFQEGVELLIEHHVHLNCMQLLLETAKAFDERAAGDLAAAAAEVVISAAEAPLEREAEALLDAVLDDLAGDRLTTAPTEGGQSSDDEDVRPALESAGKD